MSVDSQPYAHIKIVQWIFPASEGRYEVKCPCLLHEGNPQVQHREDIERIWLHNPHHMDILHHGAEIALQIHQSEEQADGASTGNDG